MSKLGLKSLKINMLLNALKGLLSVIFPLITFPYVSKVLGVDNLGKYNFANSIINYFVLFAGLGISTYAIREGARKRENKEELEAFSSQMLSINIYSMVASYLLFFILLLIVPKFHDYRSLLIIFSLQIVFKTIGIEWLYSIYEDYIYITIRSIAFQVLSIILLFVFVKNQDDVNKYALITVISAVGSNLLNFIHGRKYCHLRLTNEINWGKHFKPILVLFAMTATVVIYVSSDATILGFLCDDYTVGIYSVSVKVYTIVKTLLSSILVVSIPRLSALLGENKLDEFSNTAGEIYNTLITVVTPAVVGIIILRKEVVLVISEKSYISAVSSLSLLSIALFFCLGAWFWGQCILVPYKKEEIVFKVTIVSAVVNIVLNLIMIPFWKENAAAITTIIAEGISFIWCRYEGIKLVDNKNVIKEFLKVLCGCLLIAIVGAVVHLMNLSMLSNVLIIIIISVLVFCISQILLRNNSMMSLYVTFKTRIKNGIVNK